jgi:hypothetical protein
MIEVDRRRPPRRARERAMSRPDRVALWAVLLCLLLVVAAATSAHAAVGVHASHARHAAVRLHASHARHAAVLVVVRPR